ncbi:MAG: hypothetical protein CSB55_04695 [Candidatus Cloacimonadota bacterium]|nr:MAG: hypothetical protein CSB55_04695 [Candidatus Cloacimonadota bacterium]
MNCSYYGKKVNYMLLFLLVLTAIFNLNADPIYTEDFESGNLDNWHVVNGEETNQWYVGQAGAANGSNGAFISEDGTNASYDITESSIVFIYRDIMIPDDAVLLNLSFNWKGGGEATVYDWGRVYWATSDITPEAGTAFSPDYAVTGFLNDQETFTSMNIPLDLEEGQTAMRLIFGWKNDGSMGTGDPFCIDDISIDYQSESDPPVATNLVMPEDGAEDVFKYGTLEWEEASGATGYKLYFGTDGEGVTSPSSLVDGTNLGDVTTYLFNDLEWEETYYWQIVPTNEYGDAVDCPIWSFTVIENPVIVPPALETFDTYLPVNWSEAKGLLANPTEFTQETSSWAADGFGNVGTSGSARVNIYSTFIKEWLFSPYFDLGSGEQQYKLEFDIALTPYSGTDQTVLGEDDRFVLLIKTEDQTTWSEENIVLEWDESSYISPTGNHQTVDLSDYTGIVKFAFYGESTVSGGDINVYVDNVSVTEQTDEAQLVINESSVEFPATGVGGTSYFNLEITNSGGSDLVISDIIVDNPFSVDFTEVISPSESEDVLISFSPETAGDFTDTLRIVSNNLGGDVLIPVSGTGYNPLEGDIITNAFEINFDGTEYTASGNTDEYNDDYDLPYADCQDVVYKLNLESDYVMTISLLESEFDTKIAIYEDNSDEQGWVPGSNNYIAYNDDYYGRNISGNRIIPKEEKNKNRVLQSKILDLPLQQGSYFIIVDGYGNNDNGHGNYTLEVTGTTSSLASLSGTVTDVNTGNPVEGANVSVVGFSNALTDMNGYYQINSIVPGNYSVTITCGGYYDYQSEDSLAIEGDVVHDVALEPLLLSVVTGTVTDAETNEVIPGITVNYGGNNVTVTDENGEYRYDALLQDSYTVTAYGTGYFEYASPEQIVVDQDSVNYDFQMIPHQYGIVSGTVTDQDNGETVEGANVFINGVKYTTDENGNYTVGEMIYGNYQAYCMGLNFYTDYSVDSINVNAENIIVNFSLQPHPDNGDTPGTATPVYGEVNGTVYSVFDQDDVDWFVFYADAGTELSMYTERHEISDVDTKFYFYGPHSADGSDIDLDSPIAVDDDSNSDFQPHIDYPVTDAGCYFLRVASYNNSPSNRLASYGDYKLFIEGDVYFANSPQNLTAEVVGFDVNLSWDSPEMRNSSVRTRNSRVTQRDVTAYKIFRDNAAAPLATISGNETTYSDQEVPSGTHVYWVTAVHNGSAESEPSNEQEVTIEEMTAPYGLELSTNLDSVFLEWNFVEANSVQHTSRNAVMATREISGFKIYRNDTFLDYLEEPDARTYTDTGLEAGNYEYYLTAVYYDQYESSPSNIEDIDVEGADGKENDIIPSVTEIKGNNPNPFNPETQIEFSLSRNDNVKLMIYNAKGQLVKVLVDEFMKAGNHYVSWQGRDSKNREVASGIYFCSMKTSNYKSIKKMMLMK